MKEHACAHAEHSILPYLTMGFTFREPPSLWTAPGDHDGRVSVCTHTRVCLLTEPPIPLTSRQMENKDIFLLILSHFRIRRNHLKSFSHTQGWGLLIYQPNGGKNGFYRVYFVVLMFHCVFVGMLTSVLALCEHACARVTDRMYITNY